jgi:L-alanine-DL-glutamate epimerase-like enolase superfamily enzyme
MTDMTIRAVRTTLLRVPWPESPWMRGHAFGPARNVLVLEVETAGGIVGMGYLFVFRPGLRTVAACLDETIIPRVIGKDATAVEAIWQDLWRATMTYGRGGIVVMAMSALDIALWDAIGKRAGLPLHRLWGHFRSAIPAYGSGCWRGSGGDGMIAKAQHYVAQGYKAIKMQVAHTQDAGPGDRPRERAAHARGARARHRHHDRRQHGLERRPRDPDGAQVRGL